MSRLQDWIEDEGAAPTSVVVGGVELTRGARVRLWPGARADIFDLTLTGRAASVAGIEQDQDGNVHLAVTLDDDPGADLGRARFAGHRFFFSPDEVEPLSEMPETTPTEILVAGIGNVFLGDDGFGVAVAELLGDRPLPAGVEVVDFGIRGMDLAYALQEGYEAVIFVDVAARGESPGTLSVIEADVSEQEIVLDTHGMDPSRVLRLAAEMGPVPGTALVVACEPQVILDGEDTSDVHVELSEPVEAALDPAAELVVSLAEELLEKAQQRHEEVE